MNNSSITCGTQCDILVLYQFYATNHKFVFGGLEPLPFVIYRVYDKIYWSLSTSYGVQH